VNPEIFINNTSVIDLGRWSFKSGSFRGDSFNCHCVIGGPADSDEGVVVDFSTGKGRVKALIDQHITPRQGDDLATSISNNGFDHKLFVPSAPAYRTLTAEEQSVISEVQFCYEFINDSHCRVTLEKVGVALDAPVDALRSLPADVLFDIDNDDFGSCQRYIAQYLAGLLPELSFTIFLDRNPHINIIQQKFGEKYSLFSFNYTHGLPNSTSYGCQNILHGHSSFVASVVKDDAARISGLLDGAFIHNGKHWDKESDTYSYTTPKRGAFGFVGAKRSHAQFLDVGTEPTIENIAQFVAQRLDIRAPFFISEGPQKGCYWTPS